MDSRKMKMPPFKLGEMVYLITDTDQLPRQIIAIQLDISGGATFLTAAGNDKSWHFAEEMSAQAQTLLDSVEQLRVLVGGKEREVRGTRATPKVAPAMAMTMAARKPAAAVAFKPKGASSQIPLEGDFQDF